MRLCGTLSPSFNPTMLDYRIISYEIVPWIGGYVANTDTAQICLNLFHCNNYEPRELAIAIRTLPRFSFNKKLLFEIVEFR